MGLKRCFCTERDAGYVDGDFFTYRYDSPVNRAPMPHPVASRTAPGMPDSENDKALKLSILQGEHGFGNFASVD